MKTALLALLLALAAVAQTTVPLPALPATSMVDPLSATAPTLLFGGAIAISPYNTNLNKYSGIGTLAVRIANTNLWSWSTLQMIPGMTTGALLSTGLGYTVKTQGPWSVTAIVSAGVATGGAVTLGTFSGGGVITYTVSDQQKLYVTAGMTILAISGNTVAPSFGLGFAKGF